MHRHCRVVDHGTGVVMMKQRRGYSLLELTVALSLLAVILGIVGYVSAKAIRGLDEQQASLRISAVVTAEFGVAATWGRYTPAPTDLTTLANDIDVVAGPAEGDAVSIAVSTTGVLAVTTRATTECIYVMVSPVDTGTTPTQSTGTTTAPCSASAVLTDAGLSAVTPTPLRP
jgi:prepilin-type N-terminal cleavage/methylation domain-containing protein